MGQEVDRFIVVYGLKLEDRRTRCHKIMSKRWDR